MRTDDAGLIGREHPAALLRAEIGRAAASHGGLIFVTGESGIGKTSLVTSAAEEARALGALVLSGSCWDSDSAPGYWPWTQVIRGIGQTSLPASSDDFQLFDAVTTELVALSQSRPVVVVLDDLHWADAASLRLLEFVAKHTWFERLLLIGTYRDAEAGPLLTALEAKATTITLTGLEPHEVGELVNRTAGRSLEPSLVAEVHRRTGGNPFFVEQTARLWRSGGSVTTLAPGVREAVRRRLSLLPPAVARLLSDAAVLGREFHRQVLAAMVGSPVAQVDRLLDEALTAGLVVARGGGVFAFAHDLVRETLYAAIDDLASRHAAVVLALDDSALAARVHPAELARHAYLAADAIPAARAIDHLQAAAADADRRLATEECLAHRRRAYELAPGAEPRRRVTVALELAGALQHTDDKAAAGRVFQEAAAQARALDDAALLARVALSLKRFSVDEAAPLIREAHEKLIGDVGSVSADRLAQELAVHLAVHARRGHDDEALMFGLWAYHDSVSGPDAAARRVALTDELVELARRKGDFDTENFAAALRWVALIEAGDPRFLPRFRDYIEISSRSDAPRIGLSLAVDQSIIATLLGRFGEAQELLDQVVEQNAERRHEHLGYMFEQHRWALLLLQGRFEELEEVHAALRRSRHPWPRLLEALTAVQRGDDAASLPWVEEPDERWVRPLWLRYRAQLAAATRDPALCAWVREELEPYREQWTVSMYGWDISGPTALWLAVVDAAQERWEEAISGFTAAAHSADLMQARPWSIEARSRLVEALLARDDPGDVQAADELLAPLRTEATALGMQHTLPSAARPAQPLAPGAAGVGPAQPLVTGTAGVGPAQPLAPGASGAVPVQPFAPGSGPVRPGASVAGVGPVPFPEGREDSGLVGEFRKDGSVWSLSYGGRTVHLPDAKGLHDLRTLLGHAGTDLPAVVLLDPAGGDTVVAARQMGGDAVLDDEAKARYRRRLAQLDEEIDRAVDLGDDARAAEHDVEREALLAELRAATGLGGRDRRLGDEAERARKTVTARIRDTLRKLDQLHPELATHLRTTISTGATCRYQPDTKITWHL